MSEPFRPYEKLVEITLLGKKFQVPERNSLLRCFQFIRPETIPYGRFCWNQDCQYCRVTCQLPDDDDSREMMACKFIVMPGMEITELSQEIKWCMRSKLPQDDTLAQPCARARPAFQCDVVPGRTNAEEPDCRSVIGYRDPARLGAASSGSTG